MDKKIMSLIISKHFFLYEKSCASKLNFHDEDNMRGKKKSESKI